MSKALHLSSLLGILFGTACSAPIEESNPPALTGGRTGGSAATGGRTAGTPAATGGVAAATGGSNPQGGGEGNPGTGGSDAGGGQEGDVSATPDGGGGSTPVDPGTPGPTDLAKHKFSKVLTLNTTAAGANVPGDVAKFPVAVLLNATNFDFAQAKAAGEDIRFSTMEGALLPYAIEQWDAAGKLAALWVKVDVKGNSTQTILMHWGNPEAQSASNSAGLFSKEDNYLGVYHLNDEGGNTPDGYKDASWNAAHLTGRNMDAQSRGPARVGGGLLLSNPGGQGKNQWVGGEGPKFESAFNASAEAPITATAWALGKSFSGYYETVFSKGDTSWTLQRDYQGRTEACTWSGSYHSCAITKAPVVNKWTHYMVVQTTSKLMLYIDGKKATEAGSFNKSGVHGFAISHNMQSDKDELKGKREWDGQIDEARVMSVAKDANWALLDFESQKEGSKFVSFGATTNK